MDFPLVATVIIFALGLSCEVRVSGIKCVITKCFRQYFEVHFNEVLMKGKAFSKYNKGINKNRSVNLRDLRSS